MSIERGELRDLSSENLCENQLKWFNEHIKKAKRRSNYPLCLKIFNWTFIGLLTSKTFQLS